MGRGSKWSALSSETGMREVKCDRGRPFGAVNPGGRLPLPFRSRSARSLYYNHRPTGGADVYADLSGDPLLRSGRSGYTSFRYENLVLCPKGRSGRRINRVSAKLTNTRARAGDEVVSFTCGKWGPRDPAGQRLRGFRRVTRSWGSRDGRFTLGNANCRYLTKSSPRSSGACGCHGRQLIRRYPPLRRLHHTCLEIGMPVRLVLW
jgi:hypothetical protein